MIKAKHKKLVLTFAKFATSSLLATFVDILLFIFLFSQIFEIFWAEFFAGFVGMIINFFLQRKYVFNLQRNAYLAFAMSIAFSLVALLLGSFLMKGLIQVSLFNKYLIIPKIIVVGFKFVFNFFSKKWIFEKQVID